MFRLGAVYTSSSSGIGEETRDRDRVFLFLCELCSDVVSHGPLLGLRGSYGPLIELGGSPVPFLRLKGSHKPLLGMRGSHEPLLEMGDLTDLSSDLEFLMGPSSYWRVRADLS